MRFFTTDSVINSNDIFYLLYIYFLKIQLFLDVVPLSRCGKVSPLIHLIGISVTLYKSNPIIVFKEFFIESDNSI
jgi:hypothetical protein